LHHLPVQQPDKTRSLLLWGAAGEAWVGRLLHHLRGQQPDKTRLLLICGGRLGMRGLNGGYIICARNNQTRPVPAAVGGGWGGAGGAAAIPPADKTRLLLMWGAAGEARAGRLLQHLRAQQRDKARPLLLMWGAAEEARAGRLLHHLRATTRQDPPPTDVRGGWEARRGGSCITYSRNNNQTRPAPCGCGGRLGGRGRGASN
jgi:hypothetical protein